MKGLAVWQPWASLIALEAKHIETRGWAAPRQMVGQRLAIHATLTRAHLKLCRYTPFNLYLPRGDDLPLGAIIATAVLDRCELLTRGNAPHNPHELAFGNFYPGRYAWHLRDVIRLAEPVPWRGSQGIFDVPDGLLGAAA